MVLSSGSRLGNYEILEPLGVGGMGEVYRARDHKLDRDVALKVLPDAFASDRDRMARFEREAKVLASLNHHHIASIYGLEEAGSTRALVMEVVEGPTLAERIEKGAIPIDEAIVIAKQMAEALEYAHERSIIHRDLKPANLKLTEEGDVKLLDFGLAKALEGDVGKAQDDSHSPTLTRATEAGVLLGTAGYMSPEQAKGKPVDRRADIWAFGVVLFEMLTGRRLFAGETASETLAFVMTKEPGFDALPSGTPASVRDLLRRCLTKDPQMRLQAIGEARVALSLSEPAEEASEVTPARRPSFLPWVVAVVCAGVAIVALLPRAKKLEAPVRLNVELGAGLSLDWSQGAAAVLSPDGSTLAFVAERAEISRRSSSCARSINHRQRRSLAPRVPAVRSFHRTVSG